MKPDQGAGEQRGQEERAPQQDVARRRPETTVKDLSDFLQKHIGSIKSVAAQVINPERMVRIVIAAATRSPLLVKCDQLSVLRSCAKAAELGLEVEGGLGEGYLVPYWNTKRSVYEAQFIPGYRGLIKLARRSGEIAKIEAHEVHASDAFDYEYGTNQRLVHRPALEGDRGKVIAFYALAQLADGVQQFEVMSVSQVDAIRSRSKAKDSGPWVTDYNEMGRKTTVRRISKYLPLSIELAEALTLQAKAEAGEFELLPPDESLAIPMPKAKGQAPAAPEQSGGEEQPPPPEPPENAREQRAPSPADKPPAAAAAPKGIGKGALQTIQNHLKAGKLSEQEFCVAFDLKAVEHLTADKLDAALAWISEHRAA